MVFDPLGGMNARFRSGTCGLPLAQDCLAESSLQAVELLLRGKPLTAAVSGSGGIADHYQ